MVASGTLLLAALAATLAGYAAGRTRPADCLTSWAQGVITERTPRSPAFWAATPVIVLALAATWTLHPRRSAANRRSWHREHPPTPAPALDLNWPTRNSERTPLMPAPAVDQTRLHQLTEALLTTWHDRVEHNVVSDPAGHCAALAATALTLLPAPPAPEPVDHRLPPYSGEYIVCAKCSHDTAITRHKEAGEHGTNDRPTYGRSPKGERLERECWRCDFSWDEALAPPTGPAPHDVTVDALARLLEGAHEGWALDLSPDCAEHMARELLDRLNVRYRHDYHGEDDQLEEPETAHDDKASTPTLTGSADERTTP
ncbi:hypothetical protein ACFT0G_25375 [Streptomyces sp. NPDC057020]|uniref:hypothetical protein n=1 Tax=unclassified Streptomyces TaxID=2593676 RepID=UPI00363F6383